MQNSARGVVEIKSLHGTAHEATNETARKKFTGNLVQFIHAIKEVLLKLSAAAGEQIFNVFHKLFVYESKVSGVNKNVG